MILRGKCSRWDDFFHNYHQVDIIKFPHIYFLTLGPMTAVVINSVEAVREALLEKGVEFSGRPESHTSE